MLLVSCFCDCLCLIYVLWFGVNVLIRMTWVFCVLVLLLWDGYFFVLGLWVCVILLWVFALIVLLVCSLRIGVGLTYVGLSCLVLDCFAVNFGG